MIFWVDAQLPPALAQWLRDSFHVEATAIRDLGLREATDRAIFESARERDAAIITKDSDFVDLVTLLGPPPRILWVTCGNVTNRHLRSVLVHAFPEACALLSSGEPIVEIGRD
jgi:predicted nuclease of predicted toxin-antitoxin system